jgi:hypothetical protein
MWSLVRAGTQAWPATVAVIDRVRAHANVARTDSTRTDSALPPAVS